MIRAAAIAEFDLIGNWEHEMLKYGQAIIHDKIVVIDPLSDDCVVVTGSHNLGFKVFLCQRREFAGDQRQPCAGGRLHGAHSRRL